LQFWIHAVPLARSEDCRPPIWRHATERVLTWINPAGRPAGCVLDRAGLERRTFECYAVVKKECDRLLPATPAN